MSKAWPNMGAYDVEWSEMRWATTEAAPAAIIGNLKAALGANGKVKITFDGAGTLQTSTTLNGTFADSAIKSGDEITVDGAALFIRAKR